MGVVETVTVADVVADEVAVLVPVAVVGVVDWLVVPEVVCDDVPDEDGVVEPVVVLVALEAAAAATLVLAGALCAASLEGEAQASVKVRL